MAEAAKQEPVITMWSKEFTYDHWMKSKGIPIQPAILSPISARLSWNGGKSAGANRRLSSSLAKKASRLRALPRFLPENHCRR